jgi:uncharacterized protein YeaO (DUF488 family)
MAVHVVRLGSPKQQGEGVRVGTVRRPPRGVPKGEIAARNFYDVWLPVLAPSAPLVALAQRAEDERAWNALSHTASFSVGCYCENEARCHRSVLKVLLRERGAAVA